MKIKNQLLLNLKIVKTKICKKFNSSKNLSEVWDFQPRLRKSLKIINKFNANNKKILFLGGVSNAETNKIIKNSNHIFIPSNSWKFYVSNNKNSALIKNLKKNSSLIIVLDEQINIHILKQNCLQKIPVIFLGAVPISLLFSYFYVVPGSYFFTKAVSNNNFFLLLVKSLLKKN